MEIDGKVCRTCLDAETNLLSLDVKLEDQLQGIKMLEFLLGTEVHVHENFSGICESCMENLRVSYTFKQKCSKSEMKITEYLFADQTNKIPHGSLFVEEKVYMEDDPLTDTMETVPSVQIKEDDELNFEDIFDMQESPTLQEENKEPRKKHSKKKLKKSKSTRRAKSAALELIREVNEDNNEDESDKPLKKEKTITRNCKKCNIAFPNMKTYSLHYRTEHTERLVCEDCGKSIARNRYKTHITRHLGKTFCCSLCTSRYSDRASLRDHLLLHMNEKNYVCHYCNEGFSTSSHRSRHILKYHETPEKKFACTICQKKFTKRHDVTRHIRRHQADRRHPCTLCSKRFFGAYELKEHMVEHTGEKNHICPVCSKAFAKSHVLKVHMGIHKEERDFVCEVCNKGFTQCHVLRKHYSKAHPDVPPPPKGAILDRSSRAKMTEAKRAKYSEEARKKVIREIEGKK